MIWKAAVWLRWRLGKVKLSLRCMEGVDVWIDGGAVRKFDCGAERSHEISGALTETRPEHLSKSSTQCRRCATLLGNKTRHICNATGRHIKAMTSS
jgi:hypothetical protein